MYRGRVRIVGRVSKIKMDLKQRRIVIESFFKALAKLPDGERRFFLERFLTPTELEMLAKRLAVLKEVVDEKKSYAAIKRKLKVNQSTIGRLRNSIRRFGGDYKALIMRLKAFDL